MSVRIVIADDHIVLREGVKALLNAVDGWEVVGEADDGLGVVSLVESRTPDILIIDLSMPNLGGIEAISRIQKSNHHPAILVLSAREDHISVGEAMRAGAKGFIPKSSTTEELHFAIRSLMKGQTYLSPSIAATALQSSQDPQDASPLASLTSREREVMKLLSEGRPNRDVAKLLHISARTIDSHRANIMKKLGVNSNAELVTVAIKSGLIE